MKKSVWILVFGIVLIGVGAGGILYTKADTNSSAWNQVSEYCNETITNTTTADNYEDDDADYDAYCDVWSDDVFETENKYPGMRSMMSGFYNNIVSSESEAYAADVLTEEVEQYIADFDNSLEIGDTFVLDNGTYYYSIVESDTGKGAMELLVNPYTKAVTLEYGPAMMWNLKYGMHQYSDSSCNGRGIMGRGMMGYYYDYEDETYYNSDYEGENDLTTEEAYDLAAEYFSDNTDGVSVDEDGLAYYGYYTFHVVENGETIGIISVNGFTGTVWFNQF